MLTPNPRLRPNIYEIQEYVANYYHSNPSLPVVVPKQEEKAQQQSHQQTQMKPK